MKSRIILLTLLIQTLILLAYYHFNNYNTYILIRNTKYIVTPLFLLILYFFCIRNKYQANYKFRIIVIFFLFLVVLHTIIVSILIPVYSDNPITITNSEASKKILDALAIAKEKDNDLEIQEFYNYYAKRTDIFTETDVDIEQGYYNIPSTFEQQKYMNNKNKFYTPWVTSRNVINLGKKDLVFNIKNYIDDGYLYTAYALLIYYEKIYGYDSNLELLNKEIEKNNIFASYIIPNYLKTINYYKQMNLLYDIAKKDKYSVEEVLLANYILDIQKVIYKNNKQLDEIVWLQSQITQKLEEHVFYANEARVNLFHLHFPKPITFIEELSNTIRVWNAKDNIYLIRQNIIYLKDLELLEFSKSDRQLQSHIYTPYAMIKNNKLYLHSIEISAIGVEYKPTIISNNTQNAIPNQIQLESTPSLNTIATLQPIKYFVDHNTILNIITILKNWYTYKLPTILIYENLISFFINIGIFIFLGFYIIRYNMYLIYKMINYTQAVNICGIMVLCSAPLQYVLTHFTLIFLRASPIEWQIPILLVIVASIITTITVFLIQFVHLTRHHD